MIFFVTETFFSIDGPIKIILKWFPEPTCL